MVDFTGSQFEREIILWAVRWRRRTSPTAPSFSSPCQWRWKGWHDQSQRECDVDYGTKLPLHGIW